MHAGFHDCSGFRQVTRPWSEKLVCTDAKQMDKISTPSESGWRGLYTAGLGRTPEAIVIRKLWWDISASYWCAKLTLFFAAGGYRSSPHMGFSSTSHWIFKLESAKMVTFPKTSLHIGWWTYKMCNSSRNCFCGKAGHFSACIRPCVLRILPKNPQTSKTNKLCDEWRLFR